MSHTEDPVTNNVPSGTLSASSTTPYAGASLTLTFAARCPHGCDLKGKRVSITDQEGRQVADPTLVEFDGNYFVAESVEVTAPLVVGEFAYHATLPAHVHGGQTHASITADASVEVKAHEISLRSWNVPSAITSGESFGFQAGMKCFAECNLAGRELVIFDSESEIVSRVTLLETPWAGTDALYYGEITAVAPAAPGDHKWVVKTAETHSYPSHPGAAFEFLVRVVAAPDVEVTIKATDHETGSPVKGLHVQMHPYRAFTDEDGIARIKVRKGGYQLFVTGFNYIGHREPLEVSEDVTVTAELVVEKEIDPYDAMH